MDDLEKELKLTFIEESKQLLIDTEQCFLELEGNPQETALLDKIFRLAHNLKGSSRAVGLDELGAFTHEFESLLLKLKKGEIDINSQIVSLLLRCNDHIKFWVDSLQKDLDFKVDSSDLILDIQHCKEWTPQEEGTPEAPVPQAENELFEEEETNSVKEQAPKEEAVEEQLSKKKETLEGQEPEFETFAKMLAQETEERLSEILSPPSLQEAPLLQSNTIHQPPQLKVISSSTQNTSSPHKPLSSPNPQTAPGNHAAPADESIRISLSRLERLINYVGELVIFQAVLQQQAHKIEQTSELRKTIQQMGKVTKEVQEISMSLRMVPLKQTFQKMQRIVRDTCATLGKKVVLSLVGEDTEVDKTVLEALSDPLVHLIRNAVDHGIESMEKRKEFGKSETGNVLLKAYHKSGKLVIEIHDDGGGIDPEKLKQNAIAKGLLKPNQILSEKEAIDLIFQPGFSTKTEVTEVSGRGVGMDVVKTNIQQLQGEILVETELRKGSLFQISLPLTLAIIDGMVVTCGNERFVIPLAHVHESLKPQTKDIQYATNIGEVLLLRGENIPIIRLSKALGKKSQEEKIAIIIKVQNRSFATLVDDIVGQYQVVIKKLGPEIQHLKGYSGTAILGDGRPALILELPDLVHTLGVKSREPSLRQVSL